MSNAADQVKYISARIIAKLQHQVIIEPFENDASEQKLWKMEWAAGTYYLVCAEDSTIMAFLFGSLDETDLYELNNELNVNGHRGQLKRALAKLIKEYGERTPLKKVKRKRTKKDARIDAALGEIAQRKAEAAQKRKPFWEK